MKYEGSHPQYHTQLAEVCNDFKRRNDKGYRENVEAMIAWIKKNGGNYPPQGKNGNKEYGRLYNHMKTKGSHPQYHKQLAEVCDDFKRRNDKGYHEKVEAMIAWIKKNGGNHPPRGNEEYGHIYTHMKNRGSHPQYHKQLAEVCEDFRMRKKRVLGDDKEVSKSKKMKIQKSNKRVLGDDKEVSKSKKMKIQKSKKHQIENKEVSDSKKRKLNN